VQVQKGKMAESAKGAGDVARWIKAANPKAELIVKSQIHAGGRGKGVFDTGFKGGVKICETPAQVEENATQMLGHKLVTKQTGPLGASRIEQPLPRAASLSVTPCAPPWCPLYVLCCVVCPVQANSSLRCLSTRCVRGAAVEGAVQGGGNFVSVLRSALPWCYLRGITHANLLLSAFVAAAASGHHDPAGALLCNPYGPQVQRPRHRVRGCGGGRVSKVASRPLLRLPGLDHTALPSSATAAAHRRRAAWTSRRSRVSGAAAGGPPLCALPSSRPHP
jgi:hypothetical protein